MARFNKKKENKSNLINIAKVLTANHSDNFIFYIEMDENDEMCVNVSLRYPETFLYTIRKETLASGENVISIRNTHGDMLNYVII